MTPGGPRERYDWLEAAGCRGVELDVFFPVGQGRAAGWDESRAKAICHACPVVDACREWALRVAPEFGIFGGLDPDERRGLRLTRRRRRTSRPFGSTSPH